MIEDILVSVSPGQTRIACLARGRVVELHRFLHGRTASVGNVYLGRITRIASGIGAAFVDIGDSRAGFLPLHGHHHKELHEGARVIVQVTREAEHSKGAQLSTLARIPGRFLVFSPGGDGINVARRIEAEVESDRLSAAISTFAQEHEGWIARTNAAGADLEALAREAETLRKVWSEITDAAGREKPPAVLHREPPPIARVLRDKAGSGLLRIVVDDSNAFAAAKAFIDSYIPEARNKLQHHAGLASLFEQENVEAEFDALHQHRVSLQSGGSLVIDHTEALWAIDVNTGRNVSGHSPDATILATNLEAADEIARQIRLRDLGGLIVIDFVHMEHKADRDRVEDALQVAMADDPSPFRLAGFSELGLAEISRRRTKPSMADEFDVLCPTCHGSGLVVAPIVTALAALRAATDATHAGRHEPVRIHVPAQVVAAFETPEGKAGKQELSDRLGRSLEIIPDSTIAAGHFKLG
jgi:Rne/Rng family ribonuclease